jgi:hypothetical protein
MEIEPGNASQARANPPGVTMSETSSTYMIQTDSGLYWSDNYEHMGGFRTTPVMLLAADRYFQFRIGLIDTDSDSVSYKFIQSVRLGVYLQWVMGSTGRVDELPNGAAIIPSSVPTSVQWADVPSSQKDSLAFIFTEVNDNQFQIQLRDPPSFYLTRTGSVLTAQSDSSPQGIFTLVPA